MTSPCSIASWRRPVTANSRAMITIATHALTRSSETRLTSAAVTSSLSASGSISLPNVVTLFWRRAIQPSRASVNDASAKTAAASRVPAPALLHERRDEHGHEQDPQEREDVRQIELEHPA